MIHWSLKVFTQVGDLRARLYDSVRSVSVCEMVGDSFVSYIHFLGMNEWAVIISMTQKLGFTFVE